MSHELDPGSSPRASAPVGARALLGAIVALLSLAACSRAADEAPARRSVDPEPAAAVPPVKPEPEIQPTPPAAEQWYRVVVTPPELPQVPFFMQLPPRGSGGVGKIVSGKQETELDVSWARDELTLVVPLMHASVEARVSGDGALVGTWKVDSRSWGQHSMPFRAAPIAAPAPETRFDEASLPGVPIDLKEGRTTWRARFSDSGVAKIELLQAKPGVFEATAFFPTGNMVHLAGNGRGRRFLMSSMVGLSINLFRGELDASGKTLRGTWISGPKLEWRETFQATRVADFEVEIAVKPSSKSELLSMPQLASYAGKPLIVEVGGSWCDACKHAAAALRDVYARHHQSGLEIVSLTYEFTDDSAYNKKQAEAFKKEYEIPWEVIPVDGEADRAWEIIPPGLEGVDASGFPLTFFVNRDGSIRALHASFAGPEVPEVHRRHVEEYQKHAAAIVEERGASAR
jgi:thiol-disulfide isomerase/thioredoxin